MTIETGNYYSREGLLDTDDKINFLTTLANSADELSNGQSWPDGVNKLLKNLGEATGVSRVWIFQIMEITSTDMTQDYIFEWVAKPEYVQLGISKYSHFSITTNTLKETDDKNLFESRKKGEWQKIVSRNLAPGIFKTEMKRQDIKSMLTIPIFLQNRWWGTLGFDDCEQERDWSTEEIALLKVGSTLIANAVLDSRLDASNQHFSLLQNITDSSLWSLDFQTQHLHLSNNLSDIDIGFPANNELPLRTILKLFHPDDRKRLLQFMRSYDLNTDKSIRTELRIQTRDGLLRWIEIVASINFDALNRPVQCAGIAIDISQRKNEEEKLRQEATTDPLTGITNRKIFQESLSHLLNMSGKTKKSLSLLLIDIDYFKYVNDTWGHDCGDNVLIHMVNIVSRMLRENDVFARLGGEEFAALLPGISDKQAAEIGNRIRIAIAEAAYSYNTKTISITVSVGCMTHHCDKQHRVGDILILADQALYKAKESGRNRLCQSETCPSSL